MSNKGILRRGSVEQGIMEQVSINRVDRVEHILFPDGMIRVLPAEPDSQLLEPVNGIYQPRQMFRGPGGLIRYQETCKMEQWANYISHFNACQTPRNVKPFPYELLSDEAKRRRSPKTLTREWTPPHPIKKEKK